MSPTSSGLDFACPRCHGPVDENPDRYRCATCPAEYPVIGGIPDFRIAPDPWIGIEADRAKGLELERQTTAQGFEAMVRAYWSMTPETPPEQAERFVAHVLGAEARSREWLGAIGAPDGPASGERWLDLGCGTADLAAAAPCGSRIIGLDIAFRWLVVGQRRLAASGRRADLVCGNAEALPFPDRSFDRLVSLGMIEHCRALAPVLREARRVLRPGGRIHLRTVNRYSALSEPHVGLWGVGWLPRRWADSYVRWRNGQRYVHHWPKSAHELGREMRAAGLADVRVEAAPLLASEVGRLAPAFRRIAPVYQRLRRAPLTGRAGRWLAPLLEAEGRAL